MSDENDDIISKSLGIKYERDTLPEHEVVPDTQQIDFKIIDEKNELLDDVQASKEVVADILNAGQIAFNDLIMLAKQTENPNAYKVASDMLKNLIDAHKNYIDITEKKDKIKNPSKYKEDIVNNNTTNNNNLIMTTNDFLRLLSNSVEKKEDDIK